MEAQAVHQHQITLQLTDEEYNYLESFAATQGITDLKTAILTIIHDQWWDAQFADSADLLHQMAEETHLAYLAGDTEDFDPDTDADLQ